VTASAPTAVRPLPAELAERVDRAAEVFADHGLEATRIDELAKVTGIPRATLYYYFPGKEYILAHLLARTLAQMTSALDTAAAVPGTGLQRLERLATEHLRFIATHGPTYRLLFAELGRAASLVDIAAGVDQAILAPVRAALRDGARDGSLRVDDVGVAAAVVYGAVLVTGMELVFAGAEQTVDDRANRMLAVVLGGLIPVPGRRR
jgi:TetR/AcrR family transcriptional regulator